MKVEFDSTEKPETLRAVAAFALMLAGDIDVPSVKDEVVVHHITPDAKPSREMILPPNELPRSIVGKDPYPNGYASASPNVVPFPTAPPAPSAVPVATTFAPNAVSAVSATPANPWLVPGAVPPIPVPPMPPQFQSHANTAAPVPASPVPAAFVADVTNAASASPSNPVEYDSAGLPWDARIHNKGRTKKKDGTWKLQKGLDPIVAQTVVAELAAKRVSTPATLPLPPSFEPRTMPPDPVLGASPLPPTGGPLQPDPIAEARAAYGNRPTYSNTGIAPGYSDASASSQVPLPPAQPYRYPIDGSYPSTLPLPPFPGSPSPTMVPPSPATASLPPAPQPGTVGSVSPPVSGYKELIDKLTAATLNKTLNPAFVAPTVQRFGVPNMGMLGDPSYAALLPAISQEFDRLIAGGAPSGP